ncbi:FAD-dependent thymidylate synthase [Dictyoglomus thermophilum]|uniref:Flavin-dependent thymidylate synthase n=2 Tax=Dictyoglomus thermophilum TaxID=14 RepID=B5YDA9_DICT6|nr:FAD-dependent thymidylate synthase [Dictyoglomus thermophilum]ACI18385.1 thymidylate synthase, flavin-dependent [Dictyoglomus thermophilum H-6-12]MCX7721355.1 FAD-dependent thymidylate synthase [Dictyoglomus thermophilum]TYT22942.1 FAD-dependent thymidylate synthase [Dictyoglomus thermophilum]
MRVKLISYTPEPEKVCALAMRLCHYQGNIEELEEKLTPEEISRLLNKAKKLQHMSIFEHASFTFYIEGVSRVTTHQLVRHRIASYSQQSQRYVKIKDEYVIPETIEKEEQRLNIYRDLINKAFEAYEELVKLGVPKEDARYLLPQAVESKIIVTMNARELMHFFTLRTCNSAQWEIRELAWKMLDLVKNVAPVIFSDAGPPCFRGPCPEGKNCIPERG